uniref:Uncharacterized protein n=1 Tax=Anguilla anguilla TaxID=7936 RepID=A0A0E9XKF8_ANGAN
MSVIRSALLGTHTYKSTNKYLAQYIQHSTITGYGFPHPITFTLDKDEQRSAELCVFGLIEHFQVKCILYILFFLVLEK